MPASTKRVIRNALQKNEKLGNQSGQKIKGFARKFTREKGFVGSSTTVWLAQENDALPRHEPRYRLHFPRHLLREEHRQ